MRVKGAEEERVEYHRWDFSLALHSEDTWEEVFGVTVNANSGVFVPFPAPSGIHGLSPQASGAPPATFRQAARRVLEQAEARAAGFAARMEGRLERDRRRLRDYFGALLRDEETRRGRTPADPEKRAAARRAVELERQRKLAEVAERYALRATLRPVCLRRLELPVLAVRCEVARKQARAERTVYWNPVLTALEPLACGACGAGIFGVAFTDDTVEPRCAACL